MIFGKKKEPKLQYHELNRSRFAMALILISKELREDLETGKTRSTSDTINIKVSDNIKVKIDYACHPSGYSKEFCCSTYVEAPQNKESLTQDIKMAQYEFRSYNADIRQPWRCSSAKIIHKMPNQFIDQMNDWSLKIVSAYEAEHQQRLTAKQEKEQAQYDKEEAYLSMFR